MRPHYTPASACQHCSLLPTFACCYDPPISEVHKHCRFQTDQGHIYWPILPGHQRRSSTHSGCEWCSTLLQQFADGAGGDGAGGVGGDGAGGDGAGGVGGPTTTA